MEKPEDIKYIKRIIKSQVDSENKFKLTLCNPKKRAILYSKNNLWTKYEYNWESFGL